MRSALHLLLLAATACSSQPAPAAASCPPCDCAQPSSVAVGTASVLVSQPLDLPKASAGPVQKELLTVDIGAAGDCSVNGKALSACEGVFEIAQEAARADPQIRATIRADRDARHGVVITVMDRLKQAGINKIAFGVAAPAPSAAP